MDSLNNKSVDNIDTDKKSIRKASINVFVSESSSNRRLKELQEDVHLIKSSENGAGRKLPNQNKNINSDYMEGDENCSFCYGITFFNKKMRDNGDPIRCIGLKTTGKKVKKELLSELDDKNRSEFMSFFAFGACFWTARMVRLGCSPILVSGIESKVMSMDKQLKDKTKLSNENASSDNSDQSLHLTVPKIFNETLRKSVRVSQAMWKKTERMWTQDFWRKYATNSVRMYNSSCRLGNTVTNWIWSCWEPDE